MSNHKPTIFLIPTVLAEGTSEEVLPGQVRSVIGGLDVFFVENIRSARRFISSLKLGKVIDDLEFFELDKDTPMELTRQRLTALNKNAGIISEAGCPGVADPGAVAAAVSHELGYKVMPLVGPSSILLALMASGMSGQSFAFHGYLPIDKTLRKKAIQQLERESAQRLQTQIFMETPFRNNQLLDAVLETCGPETRLCIAANVTAPDEFIRTQSIRNWQRSKPDLHKKPTIFLLAQFYT
ncbi:Ribosomal RNA small subunit methyltransferase I [Dyadobacter sp. CECT 9275]|uniref:Ribosomal RNA small subunit methyltransferase I n=1 Tax=Dyadobacter helix TaxID=2822344 RepID=A0A916J9Q9_9BACT|nr:SAM-dependent methyltransferase [Dyadobacter sp. CECT 9275]CAG4993781.1 Ribosomal RNA small subunit methyltransferase I [Dyadobacter sp. CECT 9275]